MPKIRFDKFEAIRGHLRPGGTSKKTEVIEVNERENTLFQKFIFVPKFKCEAI